MSRAIQFKTFEKQRQALRFLRDSVTNEVLYGGGARGGKSYLGCAWVLLECFAKPGSSWMIAREELTKLRDTTLVSFFKVIKDWGLEHGKDYYYNAQSLFSGYLMDLRYFFVKLNTYQVILNLIDWVHTI